MYGNIYIHISKNTDFMYSKEIFKKLKTLKNIKTDNFFPAMNLFLLET